MVVAARSCGAMRGSSQPAAVRSSGSSGPLLLTDSVTPGSSEGSLQGATQEETDHVHRPRKGTRPPSGLS